MSTISELDAAVEEYNGVVKRQQEANRTELEPLGLKIQQLQGQIIVSYTHLTLPTSDLV